VPCTWAPLWWQCLLGALQQVLDLYLYLYQKKWRRRNPTTSRDTNWPSRSTVTSDVVGLFLVWLIRSSMSSITPVTRSPHGMIPLPTYLLISSSLIPNAYTDHKPATMLSSTPVVFSGGRYRDKPADNHSGI